MLSVGHYFSIKMFTLRGEGDQGGSQQSFPQYFSTFKFSARLQGWGLLILSIIAMIDIVYCCNWVKHCSSGKKLEYAGGILLIIVDPNWLALGHMIKLYVHPL